MKKQLLYIAFVLGMTTTLTSCEDVFGGFLDKQPSNELTEEQVFSDWTTMKQFHTDTYNFLLNGACRINNSWLDAATDLAHTSYANGGVRTSFNIGNYYAGGASAELRGIWESRYRGIRKCNMILERIDDVPQAADDSDEKYEKEKRNYKAEARFFRAYFYWEMFLRYGPVPLVTTVLDPDGDLLSDYTNRPTIKEYVVDFILTELTECESDMIDYEEGSSSANAGRVTQAVASALRSRIMLYMASDRFSSESGITWAQAADASKSFIENYGSLYSLFTDNNPVDAYTNAILRTTYEGNNKEVIFFRNGVRVGWGAIVADTPVGEGGNGGMCPSQNLVDMYDMADGSSPFAQYDETGAPVYNSANIPSVNASSNYDDANPCSNRDPRLAASVLYNGVSWGNGTINVVLGQRDNPIGNANATPTGYYTRKYMPESILSAVHTGTGYRNWILLRYAEILLNYAEALNEADASGAEVLSYLQPLRDRAGMTASLTDRPDLQTKEQRRNFIRKERTVELAFEEHRAWDVRRWNVAGKALARPIYGMEVTESNGVVRYERKVVQQRVFSEKMYLYPIPETEVWKTNIVNNPGW